MPNYLWIKKPGRLEGQDNTTQYHPAWEDLRAPATSLKVGSTAPSVNTDNGWLEFAHNADAFVFHLFQMPHGWAEQTTLKPHVHWMKTTSAAGEVEWQFSYKWVPIGDVIDTNFTDLTELTPAVSDGDTAYQHALTAFSDIDATGKTLSDMLVVRLTRLGSSYSGANHYTAAAALLEMDIHYLVDTQGSEELYTK